MKRLAIAAVGLALVVGLVASGCGEGSGEKLTLEEYFQKIDSVLVSRFERREAALSEFFGATPPAFSEEEPAEAILNTNVGFLFEQVVIGIRDIVNQMDDLDEPVEVRDAHERYIAVEQENLELARDLLDRIMESSSGAENQELAGLWIAEIDAAAGRRVQPCLTLQGIAAANGIDVDLECMRQ